MTRGSGASDLITALGLVFVLEGVLYALAPGWLKTMFERAREVDEASLRLGGLVAVGLGVAIVWLIRH